MFEAIIYSSAGIIGLTILVIGILKGWQDWIALQTKRSDSKHHDGHSTHGAARIEIADLKERVRQLEAIASGVEL